MSGKARGRPTEERPQDKSKAWRPETLKDTGSRHSGCRGCCWCIEPAPPEPEPDQIAPDWLLKDTGGLHAPRDFLATQVLLPPDVDVEERLHAAREFYRAWGARELLRALDAAAAQVELDPRLGVLADKLREGVGARSAEREAELFGDLDRRAQAEHEHQAGNAAALLDAVEAFHRRLVAYPSEDARVAAVLWCAHAHAVQAFESTPRLAFLSPEPGSGKTRALELLATLVPHPMHAVNATPAALFRRVADQDRPVTLLFDEVDTVFGPKAKDNEELRALLNAGHRRSGVAYRCVGDGSTQRVVEFPAFAPLALAGLGDLPDTVMSRSVIVRMRRRAPGEHVEPYRARTHEREGHRLRDWLADWAAGQADAWRHAVPDMPDGVTDRPADVWEPLLVVADAAGGRWPERARAACEALTRVEASSVSLGVQLLTDLRAVFGDAEAVHTEDILKALHELAEAPWADLRGKPLDARGLSYRLRKYEVRPVDVKLDGTNRKGYRREDLWDAWQRYLPPSHKSATCATSDAKPDVTSADTVADQVADDRYLSAIRYLSATSDEPLTSAVAQVAQVALHGEGEAPVLTVAADEGPCDVCGRPCVMATSQGRRLHVPCAEVAA